ncbi:MAG: peptidoglycan DD-metalloendopeptidase family protein [Acidobacteria bacterium]|nr:peptidoglycan DD-metalloendopeptidase family protein [Acidobacteriota bacterium]
MAANSLGVALLLLIKVAVPAGHGQDRAPAEVAAKRAAERIRALQAESDALASQEKTLLVELRQLELERQLKIEELTQVERDTRALQATLTATAARADTLRKTVEAQRPDIDTRLAHLYKLGRAGYWRLMLDVDDLRTMGRAYRTASALSHIDRERVEEHKRALTALAGERSALEARARDQKALQDKAARARAALDKAVASRRLLVESIDARRDLNAQLTGELQGAQQRLQASIGQLYTGGGEPVGLPLRPFRGAVPWPARGGVARAFGRQPTARFGGSAVRNGIELSVAEGQPVRAVHEGIVAFADQFTGYGNLVILEHGDKAFSLYGYLNSLRVGRGDRVDAQTELGVSGRNPAGAPALYFELRVDGTAVDPLQRLKRR